MLPAAAAAAASAPAQPLDRSTVLPGGAAAPAVPAATGAYALSDGQWLPLPRNHSRIIQSTVQNLTSKLNNLARWEDSLAGQSPDAGAASRTADRSQPVVAELVFEGTDEAPVVSAKDLVLLYVGQLTPLKPEQLARYPELKRYPILELAPEKTLLSDLRYAPLFTIVPGVIGFGPTRVAATVESITLRTSDRPTPQPAIVLRCTSPLPPGRYALACGPIGYEVIVQ